MQKDNAEIFYSKIMLFGEYTIIKGSMGLTIPYSHFNGQLSFPNQGSYTDLAFAQGSNQHLYEFWYYLQTISDNGIMLSNFNTEQLKDDLDNGLYFESTIPEGYGLGSSGALVAAFYRKYADQQSLEEIEMNPGEIRRLKEELAQLESWFHGTSSGIDPLICYLKHPLLLKDLDHIEPVGLPHYDIQRNDTIFIINSGKPRRTAPLVDDFMHRYSNDMKFQDFIDNQLTPVNNACITNLINNDIKEFYINLKVLSGLQKQYLAAMVPDSVHKLWDYGIETDDYYLKLCGSGGGGFILGFTGNYKKTKEIMHAKKMDIIPVYQDNKSLDS